MQQISKTTLRLIGFGLLGLGAFGQESPQQAPTAQQPPAVSLEARQARRQAIERLSADFSAAIKNGSLSAEEQQKAQSAVAQLGPHGKGTQRDPQARREALKMIRQMSANQALRAEDRELLAKDLAALASYKHK